MRPLTFRCSRHVFPPSLCFLNWLPVRLQPTDDVSAGGRSRGGPSEYLSAFDRITSASKLSARQAGNQAGLLLRRSSNQAPAAEHWMDVSKGSEFYGRNRTDPHRRLKLRSYRISSFNHLRTVVSMLAKLS